MEIVCSQDCVIRSNSPRFKYKFKAGKPVKINKDHSKKILKNKSFKEVKNDSSTQ